VAACRRQRWSRRAHCRRHRPADLRDVLQAAKATLQRALDVQEERRRATSRSLPIWVLPAILFFGWNELRDLMRSPVLLVCCTVLLLFLHQLYRDLDVDAELQKGMPAAAINIGRRLWPASKRIVLNTGEAVQGLVRDRFMGGGGGGEGDNGGIEMTPVGTPACTPVGTPGPSRTPVRTAASPLSQFGMTMSPARAVVGGTPGNAGPAQSPARSAYGAGFGGRESSAVSDLSASPLMFADSPVGGLRHRVDSEEPRSPTLGNGEVPKDK
jgi:hypothetical protein